ncbi:pimeloyl-ACP methyl ester carboxylesterase [Diaminobutyricimonas aerilata]|uniref:Pimeloyl-ACP methyl ester carboxylesterase n=1 Tax=Diaminobutyricimonas aerilata TaxID=1162967 RepID=A0A2M9CI36_9MICO|nr:alpha/beta hydrolase [Diaminobutyricimonas aerilata]PJJ71548.1 pimeloyl-ACP methyl ester carboxylesterase [Diaminobutyricimonas aerilata]
MIREFDVPSPHGGTLHGYDTGEGDHVVVWLHGTPNLGTPPRPLFDAAERLDIRFVGYDRPGYGGSTPRPGRDVASAADDVAAIADAVGAARFGVFGHSGGAPHALACAALLPERVTAVVAGASPAPFGADGLDWFAGMAPGSANSLRAAASGRQAKERHEASPGDEDFGFIDADRRALEGEWGWFDEVVGPAQAAGPAALIDDDLAFVAPWGFDVTDIRVPVLFVHGAEDRMVPAAHGAWLASRIPGATWRSVLGEGHVSVLASTGVPALEWLADRARRAPEHGSDPS